MHRTNVSDEPLDIIFANECRDENSLVSKRFRRLQNEIETLEKKLIQTVTIADREGDRIMKIADEAHEEQDYDFYEELEVQATVCSVIADKLREHIRPLNG